MKAELRNRDGAGKKGRGWKMRKAPLLLQIKSVSVRVHPCESKLVKVGQTHGQHACQAGNTPIKPRRSLSQRSGVRFGKTYEPFAPFRGHSVIVNPRDRFGFRTLKPMSGLDSLSRRSFSEGGSPAPLPIYAQILWNE